MRRCPNCGLLQPPSTTSCVCGFVFPRESGGLEAEDTNRLSELESKLARWERELGKLTSQLGEIHREVILLKRPAARPDQAPALSTPPPAAAPLKPDSESPSAQPQAQTPPPAIPVSAAPEFRTLPSPATDFFARSRAAWTSTPEWETIIGGSWLAKIGIVAVVLGVLYFLKYAFDNQWIGDTGRVLIGAFSGLALLFAGERLQTRGYRLYGQTLAGGGVCVLYLSIYAAFNFYSLIGQLPAMLLMALVTASCCALSYRYSSPTLATLGLVGGLLTPYWLSTGTSNQIGLLSYLLILDIGGAWLARAKKWRLLNFITFVGTAVLFVGWAEKFYKPEDVWRTEFFLVVFAALYLAAIWDWIQRRPEQGALETEFAWMLGLVVAGIFFISNEVLFFHNAHRLWVFFVLFSILALAAGWKARSSLPSLAAYAFLAIGLLPWLALEYSEPYRPVAVSALTVIWLLFLLADPLRVRISGYRPGYSSLALAVANGFFFFAVTYNLLEKDYAGWMGLMAVGVAAAHLIVGRLLVGIAVSARSLVLMHIGVALTFTTLAIPIQLEQEWITIGWGLEAVALVWIGFKTTSLPMRLAGLVVLAISLVHLLFWTAMRTVLDYRLVLNRRFLAFVAVAVIISLVAVLYRKREGTWLEPRLFTPLILIAYTALLIGASQEAWSYYSHQGNRLDLALAREQITGASYHQLQISLENSGQLALSLLWGVGSILAVVAGIVWRYRPIRLFGIALFVVAIGKVFLVDIWSLEQIYRIISTIALGALLLVVAFLYQRFKGLVIAPSGQDCVPGAGQTPENNPLKKETV
jgi:hypothetical protein